MGKRKNIKTKENIQHAARKLIGLRGYRNTTVEMIANEAGLGKSTIFYYFKHKEDILSNIMEQSVIEVSENLKRIVGRDIPPEEKLKNSLDNHLYYLTKYVDNVTIFLREFKYLPEEKKKIYIEERKSYEGLFEIIVRDLQKKGRFNGLNPKVITFGILGMCNWLTVWYKRGRQGCLSPQEIGEIFYRMLIEGEDA